MFSARKPQSTYLESGPFRPFLRNVRVALAVLVASHFGPTAASPFTDELDKIGLYARVQPARALAQLTRLASQSARVSPEETAEYLIQLGYAQLHSGQLAEAAASVAHVSKMAERMTTPDLRIKGMLLNANLLAATNDRAKAHALFWKAHALARAAPVPLRLHAAILAAQAYTEAGRSDEALALLLQAVDTARAARLPRVEADALAVLANLYDDLGDYQRGLAVIGRALELAERSGDAGQLASLRITEFILADNAGDSSRGVAALQAALSWARQNRADALAGLAHANLAGAYLASGKYELTSRHATEALRIAARTGDGRLASTARMSLGQAQLAMGRVGSGKRHIDNALEFKSRSGDKPQLLQDLDEYSRALEVAGDSKAALQALRQARALAEQLHEARRLRAVSEVQEKYESNKRKLELAELKRRSMQRDADMARQGREQVITAALAIVAVAIAALVSVLLARLKRAHQQLRMTSSRDPLTSLYNRRHFDELLADRRARGSLQLTAEDSVGFLAVLDIDHFKKVNDTYGHAAGDAVLRHVAHKLREIVRETDVIVRWGGEEFLVYIESVSSCDVDAIAPRILAEIAATIVEYQDVRIQVTVSIGFAELPLADGAGPTVERAIALADQALYQAKGAGRNRAYGLRRFASSDSATLDRIEHHVEHAAREGLCEMVAVSA